MNFSQIPSVLAEALSARGYSDPTPVQAAVLEPDAEGRDLIVSAQTGSGKTVAFGLAMAGELVGEPDATMGVLGPAALIIAPTRELALQVSRELAWLYEKTGARVATCVGGMDPSKERRSLRERPQIVVGTPGRLRDHLERGALELSALKVVVLDEADEMLDMGFRDDLEEILDATPETRRTLLFSATMPPQITKLARSYQRDALRISTLNSDPGHGDIAYQVVTVSPADIENVTVNLLRLHEAETAMLFCATRESVRRLHATLQERGFGVVALSGEHSQSERNHALQALRDGRARVCVATDVAARGIDLPTLSLVVHVEIPRDAETLQHRSGRTGRAGKKGTAVLITPYPRRKRVESMLRGANIKAEWVQAPTPAMIQEKDRERLLDALLKPVEFDEADRELGARLLAERGADDIAAMLVRSHRAALPQPEELIENSPAARQERRREGFEDVVWFRMDVGRQHNADPRWILPLLCRRGHITRNEIGAIRIGARETHFQIPRASADKFAATLSRTMGADEQDDVHIEPSDGPREAARNNRRNAAGVTVKPSGPNKGPWQKREGQKRDGQKRDGPKREGPKREGPPRDGARPNSPKGPKGPPKPWAKKPHRKPRPD